MQDFDLGSDTECNPDCVYVPAQGWWCRQCGVFRELDDTDLCVDCHTATRRVADPPPALRRRLRR
jgi:hypothetical protein